VPLVGPPTESTGYSLPMELLLRGVVVGSLDNKDHWAIRFVMGVAIGVGTGDWLGLLPGGFAEG